MLPEGCGEDGVGSLRLCFLRRHSAEVALVQRGVQASLQRGVDVRQSHQVLGFLKTHTHKLQEVTGCAFCKLCNFNIFLCTLLR